MITYIFASKYEMRRLMYVILFCLFSLCLSADEFVVSQVDSNNFLLKAIAEGVIKTRLKGPKGDCPWRTDAAA